MQITNACFSNTKVWMLSKSEVKERWNRNILHVNHQTKKICIQSLPQNWIIIRLQYIQFYCAAKYPKTNARFHFQTDEKVWNGKAPSLWEWVNFKNSPKHPIILHIWSNYFDQRQALGKSGCWFNLFLKNLDRNEID